MIKCRFPTDFLKNTKKCPITEYIVWNYNAIQYLKHFHGANIKIVIYIYFYESYSWSPCTF